MLFVAHNCTHERGVIARLVVVLALALGPGCGAGPGGDGTDCTEADSEKCDKMAAPVNVLAQLDGRMDAIADWLRAEKMTAAGLVGGDYKKILFDVASQVGCGADSARTFVLSDDVLTQDGNAFPRLISTVCSTDDSQVVNFFISAPTRAAHSDDIDPRSIEMFAWDDAAQTYRFYATTPSGQSALKVQVEPARCQNCHLTPHDLDSRGMAMTPIMNELTSPWPHWNPGAGFNPVALSIPAATQKAPNFSDLTKMLEGAPHFQSIISNAHNKVARARTKARLQAVDPSQTMALLRPLFCDEQINYVTESGALLDVASILNPGIAAMFTVLGKTGPWTWFNSPATLQLPALPDGADPVFMMPTRGDAGMQVENRLVALSLLEPMQVLRLHALDWQHPVFSDFRCGLWKSALPEVVATPPSVPAGATVGDALSPYFERVMTLGSSPIIPPGADASAADAQVIALADGSLDAARALEGALKDNSLASADCDKGPFCVVSLDRLADRLEAYKTTFDRQPDGRARLLAERGRRICQVTEKVSSPSGLVQRFENAPSLPSASCGGK
jgi:hypothetical protein